MTTSRMEAFSDGVIAIIVTIMVLELRPPADATLAGLLRIGPAALSYALSFLVIAIVWMNHHHLIPAVRMVSASLLWSNLNLLFWMSLIPFVTDFLGRNYRVPLAVACYGVSLGLCTAAFALLRWEVARQNSGDPAVAKRHSSLLRKNLAAALLYFLSAASAYLSVYISLLIFVLIPAMYFLPDRIAATSRDDHLSFG
jgi:uncharacterized membrane protein